MCSTPPGVCIAVLISLILFIASSLLEKVYTVLNTGFVIEFPVAGASFDFEILPATAVLKASFSSAELQELSEIATSAAHVNVRSFFIDSSPFLNNFDLGAADYAPPLLQKFKRNYKNCKGNEFTNLNEGSFRVACDSAEIFDGCHKIKAEN